MVRDSSLPQEPPPPEPRGPGTLGPTPPGLLAGLAVAGTVMGLLLKPVMEGWGLRSPTVAWPQPLLFWLVAAWLLALARHTHRALQRGLGGLSGRDAFARLILARATAVTAATAAGVYAGIGLGWVADPAPPAGSRALAALVAAVGSLAAVLAGLLLERACRVRDDDDPS